MDFIPSGWEFIVLLAVFVLIVGPQRLPEYTRNVIQWVRKVRRWVDDSRATVEDEMGIAIDDLRKYDPRQYDPRRIIREAWSDADMDDIVPSKESLALASGAKAGAKSSAKKSSAAAGGSSTARRSSSGTDKGDDGPKRAPFDPEAT